MHEGTTVNHNYRNALARNDEVKSGEAPLIHHYDLRIEYKKVCKNAACGERIQQVARTL